MKPQPRHYKALANWTALNDFLRTAGVEDCNTLIRMETTGRGLARETFVNRLWMRWRVATKIVETRGKR